MAAMGDQPATLVYFVRTKEMAIEVKDAKSRTPLHWAIHCSTKQILEYILAHDQNLEVHDFFGHTPLHAAISTLNKDKSLMFIKVLVVRGANIQAKTESDQTCQDLIPEDICDKTKSEVKKILRKHKCRCQFMLTFRYILKKHRRTKYTMIFYILLYFLLIFWHITVDSPYFPIGIEANIEVISHIIMFMLAMFSFFMASCRDPG